MMLNNLDDFRIEYFDEIYENLKKYNSDISNLIIEVGTIIRENGVGSVWLKPKNSYFTSLSLHVEKDKLKSIAFMGNFDFTVRELMKNNNWEEKYSRYDDLYFYFFKKEENDPYVLEISLQNKIELELDTKVTNIRMRIINGI